MRTEQTENNVMTPQSNPKENNWGFKKGWDQVPQGVSAEVRSKIMEAIGITGQPNFYKRMNGEVEPKVSEFQSIEKIFNQYGITEIWDNATANQ